MKASLCSVFSVAVVCTECEDTIVNSDQRLVLLAEQTEYQESELTYSWDLAVHQSDHTPASELCSADTIYDGKSEICTLEDQ